MRRYHWVRLFALLLMIILFATAMFAGLRGSLSIYAQSARQRSIIRSVQGIDNASSAIMEAVTGIARTAGKEQYERLLELVRVEDDSRLSENDLEGYFRLGFANKMEDALGNDARTVTDTLNSFLDANGNAKVEYDPDTVLEKVTTQTGDVIALRIRNVTITYDDPLAGVRSDTLNYDIQFPNAVFHAGNDDLFRFCMVAQKGIYFTGRTSSVIGDIYAGDHTASECREAEIVYGETGTYGGINILSTQLGVRSDRVISRGDININGSFVIFEPNLSKLDVYASRLNEIQGFSKKTSYTLDGDLLLSHALGEDAINVYHDAISLVDTSLSHFGDISIYYDSDNDRTYSGKYRKLIAGSDVEIKNDFTGIVVARSNVIIQRDVNFEGVILCGDRIYAMGNNNIVANPSVARAVIASELNGEYNIRIKDYIGGLKDAGLTDPEYYIIPYMP